MSTSERVGTTVIDLVEPFEPVDYVILMDFEDLRNICLTLEVAINELPISNKRRVTDIHKTLSSRILG